MIDDDSVGYTEAFFLFIDNLGDSVATVFLDDDLSFFEGLVAGVAEVRERAQGFLAAEIYYPFLRSAFSLPHQLFLFLG